MTPNRERKAAERQRKAAAGLVRLELWAKPADAELIRAYAARLNKQTNGKAAK